MRENVKKGEAALESGWQRSLGKPWSSRAPDLFDTDTERCADYPLAKILRGT